jgi:RNA polymerase sigma-B factor
MTERDRAAGADEDEQRMAELHERFRRAPDPGTEAELVAHYLPLARRLALRFDGRGEPLDDLIQVAGLGLVAALRRFDPDYGTAFRGFASVTIVGELRRHFRDRGWTARVGRRMQELHLQLRDAADELTMSLGRSPTISDIARDLAVSDEDVIAAMEAGHAYRPISIDAPIGEGGHTLADAVGQEDREIDRIDRRALVGDLLSKLSDTERELVHLRFDRGMSQSDIARQLGISQMHVSRLLTRTLARLRVLALSAGS